MLWSRRVFSVVLAIQAFAILAHCTDTNDPWRSMKQLPHGVMFVFVERDLTCHEGKVKTVTDQAVLLRSGKSVITIEKSNLLRVGRGHLDYPQGSLATLAVVYSGRSSWADLIDLAKSPSWRQVSISVATTGGKSYGGELWKVTETNISLRDSFGKEASIPKTEVSHVDYIQQKPLSDDGEYAWDELAQLRIFDPELYPRLFHVGDTVPVRLYDRAASEDDSPLYCR
jgi:hypothetical protein